MTSRPHTPCEPTAQLIRPTAELASCVRAYVTRSTLGAELTPAQRLNYFPATPSCVLIWQLDGRFEWVQSVGDAHTQPLPGGVLFRGQKRRPYVAYCAGPIHTLMCVLMPDAVQALTGLNPADWVDRVIPIEAVLDADWQAMSAEVQQAGTDQQRVACIESFLLPRWKSARPPHHLASNRFGEWVQALAQRAQSGSLGRSMRQMERRIKTWTGLPLRDLRTLSRTEAVFFELVARRVSGTVPWSQVASQAGYCDQAHLCRDIRRATGCSPEVLRHKAHHDEAYWLYRLWEQASVGPLPNDQV